ncbi:MAG: hypothetical protein M1834_001072 [Cirrosporium novae-zelandiae]|nr:MAG: hypothetical protein M1834_001072 [Cirrosporium novae-zelandiae]
MMEVSTNSETIDGLFARYEDLKATDNSKNQLIEELLYCLNALDQDFQREKLDHDRERHYNRDGQVREQALQKEIRMMKANLERDPFVLILIDGDGMIFNNELLRKGEEGGREAAGLLWSNVRDYIHTTQAEVPSDMRIMARIYANVKGLGDVAWRAGIIERPSVLEDFVRGFTGSKQLFDFIDVGSGKERADAKLCETMADQAIVKGITLLEGVPFEKELASLKKTYLSTKFEGLFRDSKINVNSMHAINVIHPGGPPLSTTNITHSGGPSMNSANTTHSGGPSMNSGNTIHSGGPVINSANATHTGGPPPGLTSSRSTSSLSMASPSLNPTAATWASAAMAAPPAHTASPTNVNRKPSPTETPTVARNKYQQRIDLPINFEKKEVTRIKNMKVCNNHYLRGDCPYGDICVHSHKWKPNKNEIQTLRHIARWTPCTYGAECDDPKCIYGHHCIWNKPGERSCHYGDNCYFPPDLHGVDTTPVHTVKV